MTDPEPPTPHQRRSPSHYVTQRELLEFERTHFKRVGRVRDIKWFTILITGALVTIFVGLFAVGIISSNVSLSQEKTSLDDRFKVANDNFLAEISRMGEYFNAERAARVKFEDDLRKQISGRAEDANLEILDVSELTDLTNQEVHGVIIRNEDSPDDLNAGYKWEYSNIDFILKNTGRTSSGKMWLKFLTQDESFTSNLKVVDPIDRQSGYKYEFVFSPNDLKINDIPGQFATQYRFNLITTNQKFPEKGKHKAMIKIYYGTAQVLSVPIVFVVDQDEPAQPPSAVNGILPIAPIEIDPADKNVPPDVAQFLGVWLGTWDKKYYAAIAVTSVGESGGTVKYWYQEKIGGEFQEAPSKWAIIGGGVLDLGTISLKIDADDGNKAEGQFRQNDNSKPIVGEFVKQKAH